MTVKFVKRHEVPRSRVAEAVSQSIATGKKLSTGKKVKMKPLSEVNKRFDFGQDGPKSSKYWDIHRDGVSVSSMTTWLQCREQFRLKYVEGWEGGAYSFPIEFGQAFHFLHECWVGGSKAWEKDLKEYRKLWIEEHPMSSPQAREQQEVAYAMVAAIWPHYAQHNKADLKRKWLSAEARFDYTMSTNCGMIPFKGYMDGVYRDRGIILHEMKTKSRVDVGQIEETLWLDLQVMTYLWILSKNHPKEQNFGVQYDVIRRPGTLPKKGESLTAYTKRLSKEVEKDKGHYFVRVNLSVSREHLNQFYEKVLLPILDDMAQWAHGAAPHYPTPDALVGRYGPCSMYQAIANHNFTGLRRKTCESGRKPRAR